MGVAVAAVEAVRDPEVPREVDEKDRLPLERQADVQSERCLGLLSPPRAIVAVHAPV